MPLGEPSPHLEPRKGRLGHLAIQAADHHPFQILAERFGQGWQDTLDESIEKDPGPLAEFVDLPTCRILYRRCLTSRLGDVDVMTLWVVTTFAFWLRLAGVSSRKSLANPHRREGFENGLTVMT